MDVSLIKSKTRYLTPMPRTQSAQKSLLLGLKEVQNPLRIRIPSSMPWIALLGPDI